MIPSADEITCENCGFHAPKRDLDRSCSNCFACTSCEIYICPQCRNEIVVRPMKPNKFSAGRENKPS